MVGGLWGQFHVFLFLIYGSTETTSSLLLVTRRDESTMNGSKTCCMADLWISISSYMAVWAYLHIFSSGKASVHLPSTRRFERVLPLLPTFPGSVDGGWGDRIRKCNHFGWSSSILGCAYHKGGKTHCTIQWKCILSISGKTNTL